MGGSRIHHNLGAENRCFAKTVPVENDHFIQTGWGQKFLWTILSRQAWDKRKESCHKAAFVSVQDFAAADRATPRYLEKYPAIVQNQTPFYYSRHFQ